MNELNNVSALVYTSRATGQLSNVELERILVDAAFNNRVHSVTGALLYDGFRFLQYIEGPQAALDAVFARIQASQKHAGIEVLVRGGIAERHFWNWSMACRHTGASMIQRLESARWTQRAHPHLLDEGDGNVGLTLLSAFWHEDAPAAR